MTSTPRQAYRPPSGLPRSTGFDRDGVEVEEGFELRLRKTAPPNGDSADGANRGNEGSRGHLLQFGQRHFDLPARGLVGKTVLHVQGTSPPRGVVLSMIRPAKGRGGQRGDDPGIGCRRTFGFGNGAGLGEHRGIRAGSVRTKRGGWRGHRNNAPSWKTPWPARWGPLPVVQDLPLRARARRFIGEPRPLKGLAGQRYSPERVEDPSPNFVPRFSEVPGSSGASTWPGRDLRAHPRQHLGR